MTTTHEKTKRMREGSTMVNAMGIVCVVTMVGAGMLMSARQQVFTSQHARDFIRSQIIAESGLNATYQRIKTNFSLCYNPSNFPPTDLAGGTYQATVTPVTSNRAAIRTVAAVHSVSATAAANVQNFPVPIDVTNHTPAAAGAYACAVVSGDAMTWTGSGTMTIGGGRVHANGKYKMTGSQVMTGTNFALSSCVEIWSTGSTRIEGNAQAPAWKGSSPGNVTGTRTTGAVSLVTIPDIDLTPYYNQAAANGQVYNSSQSFSGSADLVPVGGVLWVNGDLQVSGSRRLIGCFIATGNVKISGSGDQIKVANYPAVVSRDGGIDISGSGKFHGLLYAKHGLFNKSGSGNVTGTIICAGSFDKSGSWQVMNYENSTPVPPGAGTNAGSSDSVVITAWQE